MMLFGLTAAATVFKALVDDVLHDMLNQFDRKLNIDDISFFSCTLEEDVEHVRLVLQRLLQNKFVKAEKCEFHVQSVSFLGFIIEQGQIRSDPAKVEWPIPENRMQLQRFRGFANFYRCFIRFFSKVATPLNQLTSTTRRFLWSTEVDLALDSGPYLLGFLVPFGILRHASVCGCLLCLCPWEGLSLTSSWPAEPSSHPHSALVTHHG